MIMTEVIIKEVEGKDRDPGHAARTDITNHNFITSKAAMVSAMRIIIIIMIMEKGVNQRTKNKQKLKS